MLTSVGTPFCQRQINDSFISAFVYGSNARPDYFKSQLYKSGLSKPVFIACLDLAALHFKSKFTVIRDRPELPEALRVSHYDRIPFHMIAGIPCTEDTSWQVSKHDIDQMLLVAKEAIGEGITHRVYVLVNIFKSEADLEPLKKKKDHLEEGGNVRARAYYSMTRAYYSSKGKNPDKENPHRYPTKKEVEAAIRLLGDAPAALTIANAYLKQLEYS